MNRTKIEEMLKELEKRKNSHTWRRNLYAQEDALWDLHDKMAFEIVVIMESLTSLLAEDEGEVKELKNKLESLEIEKRASISAIQKRFNNLVVLNDNTTKKLFKNQSKVREQANEISRLKSELDKSISLAEEAFKGGWGNAEDHFVNHVEIKDCMDAQSWVKAYIASQPQKGEGV